MDTPTRWLITLVAPLLVLSTSGCSGILPTPPEAPPATFLLAPDLSSVRPALPSPESGETLMVSVPVPGAGYGTPRMAFMEQDYRLDYFADHQWVDPPAAMLEPLLVQALDAHPSFRAVSSDGRGIRADLRLDTLIEAFYQDFRTRPSRVRVALRVRLIDPGDGRILATRLFDDTEPAPADVAYGGVQAINRVLARLLPEIADFAAGATARLGPPSASSDPERATR